jgi:hypothetical protein
MPNFTDNRTWGLMASLTNRINQKRMDKQPLTHEELRLIMQTLNGKDKQIKDLKESVRDLELLVSAVY